MTRLSQWYKERTSRFQSSWAIQEEGCKWLFRSIQTEAQSLSPTENTSSSLNWALCARKLSTAQINHCCHKCVTSTIQTNPSNAQVPPILNIWVSENSSIQTHTHAQTHTHMRPMGPCTQAQKPKERKTQKDFSNLTAERQMKYFPSSQTRVFQRSN